jgi:hypothetical protein
MTTTEQESAVEVGSVEGHPIYFDTHDGKLYAVVNGKRIDHKTYSTLRNLAYQEHLRCLRAIGVLAVRVPPKNDRWSGKIYRPTEVKLVGTSSGYRGASRVVSTTGSYYDQPDYALVPEDAGPEVLEGIKAKIDAFLQEEAAEKLRHEAAQQDINERASAFATALGEQYPVETIYDRLTTLTSESDRNAYVEWRKR